MAPARIPPRDILRFTGLHLAQQVLFCGALIVTARTLAPKVAGRPWPGSAPASWSWPWCSCSKASPTPCC
ncbi:MAG: hypothetical protein WDN45_17525 [Caulobacteraceae bacterium]